MIYNATISCEKLEFTNFTISVRNGKLSASSRFQAQRWERYSPKHVCYIHIYVCTCRWHIQDPGTLAQTKSMYKTIYT